MANQSATTERPTSQAERFSKDEAAALRKTHVSGRGPSLFRLEYLIGEACQRDQFIFDSSLKVVASFYEPRRNVSNAHRKSGTAWTSATKGVNTKFRLVQKREQFRSKFSEYTRVGIHGRLASANGRFLRHRPERSERCLNCE